MENLRDELLDLADEADAAETCCRICRLEGNYPLAEEWRVVAMAIRNEEWRIRCIVESSDSKEGVNE